jgi:hypothetical protein
MVIGGAGSLWGPVIGSVLYVFVTDRTGSWADDDSVPALLRPFFGWSKIPPGAGIFSVLLIALMFVAPLGLVGLWKRHSPRLVRVLPRPAGSGTVAAAPGVDHVDASVSTTNQHHEGETS